MARAVRKSGMKEVPLSEIKDDLSRFLREAEKQEIVITRHGKPVARLVRAEERLSPVAAERRRKAWLELREIGRRLNINATHEEIKDWIEEGRH